jgi:hypothetical protein
VSVKEGYCFFNKLREALINWLYERITSLRGTRYLAYLIDIYLLLRSTRLVLHLVRRINQRFLGVDVRFVANYTSL